VIPDGPKRENVTVSRLDLLAEMNRLDTLDRVFKKQRSEAMFRLENIAARGRAFWST